jgi:non-reducing end alpha-L-arabinofuranosidase
MKIRNVWTEFVLAAFLGLVGGGCTLTSPNPGAGGADGSGGSAAMAGGAGVAGNQSTAGNQAQGSFDIACTGTPTPAADPTAAVKGPCDIYANDGGPCVAAHSTVRALYAGYGGPLYQVKKMDGTTKDIVPLAPGGLANAAEQDTFCGADPCTISIIYDQSGSANHLTKAPAGSAKMTPDNEANAKALPLTLRGTKVYGVHVVHGIGYRNNMACGTATGDNAETIYMVVDGGAYNNGCCFDYGNMERNSRNNGEGTMEAVYFGNCTIWGKGAADGPWVMGDLENGLWAGNVSPYENAKPITFKFVTGMVKGDAPGKNHWTIKVGDAQAGPLTVPFDGERPSSRYNPMRKEGAIGMGTGGDNSSGAIGNFFEGIMTAHYSSAAADEAVQANIVSVYGP